MKNSESLEKIKNDLVILFESHFGFSPDSVEKLKGDASMRSIYRLKSNEINVVGVYGPDINENLAFIGFTRTFRELNLPVPELISVSKNNTCYLEEDLGDITLFQLLQKEREKMEGEFPVDSILPYYESALENLLEFQVKADEFIDYSLCYQTENFDRNAWRFDQDYFLNSLVLPLFPDYKRVNAVKKDLDKHLDLLEAAKCEYFLYRDFQSRNIMVTGDGLRFIDYQSGRRGPLPYDVASLLYDAKADLPDEIREELLNYYCFMACSVIGGDTENYHRIFPSYALLRILQALGSYGNNGITKENYHYLESIPYALSNVLKLMDNTREFRHFSALKDLILKLYSEKPWEKYLQDQ